MPSEAPKGFRFGELGQRTLHRQLKLWYCPADGQEEWPVAGSIADVWSPTQGIFEIQTRSLSKLRPKLRRYLEAGIAVTVVHPLSKNKTLVTWNADSTEVVSRRKSPLAQRPESAFREIGALAEFFGRKGFRLVLALIQETEHRCADGKGSWRRQGKSVVDRVLESIVDEKILQSSGDLASLIPSHWVQPGTTASLAQALSITPRQAQALCSCLKKTGTLEVKGRKGRWQLLGLAGKD